ncbi:MAG TPA: hypothetical protein VHS58_00450 [Acetobacteraceae bacterium]|jgi:hypothetical protein|nr:hypothetical protein [Acetobacteraceae bacterium]
MNKILIVVLMTLVSAQSIPQAAGVLNGAAAQFANVDRDPMYANVDRKAMYSNVDRDTMYANVDRKAMYS